MILTTAKALPFRARFTGLLGAAATLAGVLGGCVGYHSYTSGDPELSPGGFTNPNSDPMPAIMAEALRWSITRYPAVEGVEWTENLGVPPEDARFAVNLPPGTNREVYLSVVNRISYGAVPLTPETRDLPTYHVARIWVLGDEATVDVIRPVPGLINPDTGEPVTQGIAIRLRGGMQPWRVTSHRVLPINYLPAPATYYLPEEQAPRREPMQ